jgi:peptidoglycan DL-endopeptidase CwlO
MKRRHLVPVILPILIAITVAVALPATAKATPSISAKRAQAKRIQKEIAALDTKLEMAVEQYNLATYKLSQVEARIDTNTKQLETAKANLSGARDLLAARAESIYKEDQTDILDVLLQTHSFDDLITQLDMFQRLSQSDSDAVDKIEKLRAEIHERGVALAADEKQAKELVAQRAGVKNQIQSSLAQRNTMLKGVKNEIATLERQQREAARRAAAAAAAAARSYGYTPPSGSVGTGGGSTSTAGSHPEVVAIAQQHLGDPYVWAAAGPNAFDCSGLTMYCYAQIGISLPHLASVQYNMSQKISRSAAMPGDLVVFGIPIHHVGLYIGNGMMIHAPHTGDVVRYESVDYSGEWIGFARP